MNPTATELVILLLRLGVVAGLYLFCAWVALVVARDLRAGARPISHGQGGAGLDLVVAVSPDGPIRPGQRFSLDGGATLGRDPANSIVLPDEYVSARHARFEWRGGRLWLEDLGSTNGTRVNGRAIRGPVPVVAGDLIEVGRIGFRVAPAATAVQAT